MSGAIGSEVQLEKLCFAGYCNFLGQFLVYSE
ncbi:hypothetical protein SSU05_0043 [Streptococcus suis 05ZYH33]|nr:hypothetical protein SSU05_0043 [Streptococcus suis 05ZYH33]